MKKLLTVGLCLLLLNQADAQSKKNTRKANTKNAVSKPKARPAASRPSSNRPVSSGSQRQLSEALAMVRNGQYDQAVAKLYPLSRRSDLAKERMQIKYIMGVALMELKLYQIAAFQFVDVIRNNDPKYTRQAIEKLSIAADELGDDSLLNYAISKVRIDDFPEKNKDMIYYRLGEIQIKNGKYLEATQTFARVGSSSRYAAQSRFNRGRAFLEAKRPDEAQKIFQNMINARQSVAVTDNNRVASILALARSYYQAQDWDQAIEWYRQVPRDTEFWHEALFEQSWAYLRAAKFRSALSNFQSLHSSYYDEFYIPESLLLRAIVYLYICKYDEMEKVLGLFEKSYGPIRTQLGQFVQSNREPLSYTIEIEKAMSVRKGEKPNAPLKFSFSVGRYLMGRGDVKRSFSYIKNLQDEKRTIESSSVLGRTSFAAYATKIISNRVKNTRVSVGEMIKNHMINVRNELRDLYEQTGFIRYEMINGQKEQLKKKIAGKGVESQIDDDVNRDFYVQNGYEYYPFEGEFWLDEIGNYHYLGRQSCE